MVAVFSNGKAWQFLDWKVSQPVDLFHRCECAPFAPMGEWKGAASRSYTPQQSHSYAGFGAFVHYDDEPVRGDVKGWNVHSYKVSRGKRHMDGLAVSQFWMQLGDWLKVHKPLYLLPVPTAPAAEAGGAVGGVGPAASSARK